LKESCPKKGRVFGGEDGEGTHRLPVNTNWRQFHDEQRDGKFPFIQSFVFQKEARDWMAGSEPEDQRCRGRANEE
jgi:hypothetical protein